MQKLKIIKIGGKVIDQSNELESFLANFAQMEGRKILVHGGGNLASFYTEKMQMKPNMVEGRRITDKETLNVVQMVYAGLINKNIVAVLNKYQCNALGMSGADLDSIRAVKRAVRDIDYGLVGDVIYVNTEAIHLILQNGNVPVFCSLTHDGNGQILNTNADTVATELSIALSENYNLELILCFEKSGVLENIENDSSPLPVITTKSYDNLKKSGKISDGMIPKIDNAYRAINAGVGDVIITSYKNIKGDNDPGKLSGTRIIL